MNCLPPSFKVLTFSSEHRALAVPNFTLSWYRTQKLVALDPQFIIETCFSSHPQASWTERLSGCDTEAKQNTDSNSSPRIKPSQVCLNLVRWCWLRCTQRSVLLRLGPCSCNFTPLSLPSLFSEAPSPDKVPLVILVQLQKCIWLWCLITSFRALEGVLL